MTTKKKKKVIAAVSSTTLVRRPCASSWRIPTCAADEFVTQLQGVSVLKAVPAQGPATNAFFCFCLLKYKPPYRADRHLARPFPLRESLRGKVIYTSHHRLPVLSGLWGSKTSVEMTSGYVTPPWRKASSITSMITILSLHGNVLLSF